jgi:hypothetical protein
MASKSGPSGMNQQVKPGMIITAVVVLLALISWLAYANLIAPPSRPLTDKQQETNAWIAKLAKESGGDLNKLSEEDRSKLQQMTAGHGEMALKGALNNK